MGSMNDIAAEMLEASAAGYAAAALALFASPETSGVDRATWKGHLVQRVLELAAAVRVAEPALFARRVAWLRRAAEARGVGEHELRRSLESLRAALQRELPDAIQPAVAPALELAAGAFAQPVTREPAELDGTDTLDRLALRYLATCLEGEPERAAALVLAEIANGLAPATAYTHVLLAAQREVGQLWHTGEVSIAEERLVTETTRELMALIAGQHAPRTAGGRTVIAASVSGNAHDMGLRAAADLFRIAGWRCLYLGANVPAAELARAADIFGADLVLLSATLETHLKPLGDAIAALRRGAPRSKVLVGGRAFEDAPQLAQQLGADAYAAAIDDAVAAGNALFASPA
jgi:MerR family transcriptional regulator, light-induced transcriptional regulator